MNVGLVVSGRMRGGGQRVVNDLVREFAIEGTPAKVFLLGASLPEFDEFNPIVIIYEGHYNRPWSLMVTAWRLGKAVKISGVKLLHTHGWDADAIGALAVLGTNVSRLVHLHITPGWIFSRTLKHQLRKWFTQLTLRGPRTRVVAVSDAVKRHWVSGLGVDSDRIRVVRNGVDVIRFQPSMGGREVFAPVIGVAARLAPMKGIEYLLDALGALAAEEVAFELKIAGTGGLRKSLEERCWRLGITGQTEFLGHLDDMPHFYRMIDLYALSSVSTEGLPLGVLEAMASGIPVVATTVAGTPEAVRDGVDGLLVPPRDVAALTAALRQLLMDAKARRKMGESGRTRAVEAFSLERFSDEIFDIYREMLNDNAA